MNKLDSEIELGQDLINLTPEVLIVLDTLGFEAEYPTNNRAKDMAKAVRRAFERRGVKVGR